LEQCVTPEDCVHESYGGDSRDDVTRLGERPFREGIKENAAPSVFNGRD
jgi:hypothetical protein